MHELLSIDTNLSVFDKETWLLHFDRINSILKQDH